MDANAGWIGGNELRTAVYRALRKTADGFLHRFPSGLTVQATDLVHDALIKLVRKGYAVSPDTPEFKALATRSIHNVLISHCRARESAKRGGRYIASNGRAASEKPEGRANADANANAPVSSRKRLPFDSPQVAEQAITVNFVDMTVDLLALEDGLNEVEKLAPKAKAVVVFRFFGNMTWDEVAEAAHVSRNTVEKRWNIARAILRAKLLGVDVRVR
ncbi:MAG: sigma-70 family RNA polymerase sigma factor [Phycisphaerales bacterium]|nr:sigma-70 family RNA polymerase sigma factor [Phycisphaerales bacterium]